MKRAVTILIFCVAMLLGLGMVALYSASVNMEMARTEVGSGILRTQMVWFGFGLPLALFAALVDYRWLKKISWWLVGLAAFLLVCVFVPHVGFATKGAHRWIGLPHLPHFQPSELAKLALILFLATYGAQYHRKMGNFKEGLAIPGAVIVLIIGLIFVEPDRGCSILLAAVAGAMLIVAGVRMLYLAAPAVLAAVGLAFSLLHDPMRLNRIMAWLHPERSKDGVGYQAYEAMIALGSGGWFGLGLGNSRQKLGGAQGFIPEHHTDFIFSIVGEELGLVTTLAVVALFTVFVICGIYISRHARDMYGMLLGTGLTFMIGIQAFINMGVVTSLLPNKGMPLPFISYGGSNLLLMMVSVGILLSIARSAHTPVLAKASATDEFQKIGDE